MLLTTEATLSQMLREPLLRRRAFVDITQLLKALLFFLIVSIV